MSEPFEPVLTGHAIAVLKSNDFNLLTGSSAEEVVNSCWLTLRLIAVWYRRLHPELAEVDVVLHDSLADDPWALMYSELVVKDVFQPDLQGFPEFPLEKLNTAIITMLTISSYYITLIAADHNITYEDVVEEIHEHYLEYLKQGETGGLH